MRKRNDEIKRSEENTDFFQRKHFLNTKPLLVIITMFLTVVQMQAVQPLVCAGKTTKKPIIDGKLNDECWKNAVECSNFVLNNGQGKLPKNQTRTYISYDDEYFYFAFKNYEKALIPVYNRLNLFLAKHSAKDSKVYADDSVEIFIEPENSNGNYYQFCVNSRGALYDSKKSDTNWNSSAQAKALVDNEKGVWTLEIAIPRKDLSQTPDSKTWKINLCRNARPDNEFSSWSAVGTQGFHDRNSFGTLTLLDSVPGISNINIIAKNGKCFLNAKISSNPKKQAINCLLKAKFNNGDRLECIDSQRQNKLTCSFLMDPANIGVAFKLNQDSLKKTISLRTEKDNGLIVRFAAQ